MRTLSPAEREAADKCWTNSRQNYLDFAAAFLQELEKDAEPVAWVMQSNNDGSLGDPVAFTGWSTFQKQYEKLQAHPWIVSGTAKPVPLYLRPTIPADMVLVPKSALEFRRLISASEVKK